MIKVDLLIYSFKLLLCTCFFLCISCDFYITENALSCPCSRDYFCCQKEKKCVENLYDCSNATKENNSRYQSEKNQANDASKDMRWSVAPTEST